MTDHLADASAAKSGNRADERRVLVIGESLVDVLTVGEETIETVGGSPANVALGLGRLGVPVRLHTAIAADTRGRRIAAHLTESGVESSPESWSLQLTSAAMVTVDGDGTPRYRFEIDPTLSPPTHQGEALVHIGSVSAFIPPGADVIEQFVSGLPKGILVSFDPNIRRELLADQTAARERFERLCRHADVVKLSDEDARWLYPGDSMDRVAAAIQALGPRLIAVTSGARGALLRSAHYVTTVRAVPTKVVDSVGAGDTFMAALIFGLLHRLDKSFTVETLQDLGGFAARAAAVTVQRRGADLPWWRDLV